jgi:hypothetical protein
MHAVGQGPLTLPVGSLLKVEENTVTEAMDRLSVTMVASDNDDLTDAAAWHFSNPLSNPVSTHGAIMHDILAIANRVDGAVRKSAAGLPLPELDTHAAIQTGLRGMPWMHGTPVRAEDSTGHNMVYALMSRRLCAVA